MRHPTLPRALAVSIVVLAGALTLAGAVDADVSDASIVAQAVDDHYNRLQSLSAAFSESYRGAGMERVESGAMLLRKPGKMRWDYTTPTKKIFVTDGKTAYFYVPGERQARKANVKNIDDLRSPLRFLLGKTHLAKELEQLSVTRQGDGFSLSGIPKSMRDRVDRVTLRVNAQWQIVEITIDEADGSQTEFQFSEIRENVPAADERFRFAAPTGVEVIDSAELNP
jgi:outer membrane lipoprotein carrier protein